MGTAWEEILSGKFHLLNPHLSIRVSNFSPKRLKIHIQTEDSGTQNFENSAIGSVKLKAFDRSNSSNSWPNGCWTKNSGFFPQIIHLFIGGFHEIFTIHFGGQIFPLFLGNNTQMAAQVGKRFQKPCSHGILWTIWWFHLSRLLGLSFGHPAAWKMEEILHQQLHCMNDIYIYIYMSLTNTYHQKKWFKKHTHTHKIKSKNDMIMIKEFQDFKEFSKPQIVCSFAGGVLEIQILCTSKLL